MENTNCPRWSLWWSVTYSIKKTKFRRQQNCTVENSSWIMRQESWVSISILTLLLLPPTGLTPPIHPSSGAASAFILSPLHPLSCGSFSHSPAAPAPPSSLMSPPQWHFRYLPICLYLPFSSSISSPPLPVLLISFHPCPHTVSKTPAKTNHLLTYPRAADITKQAKTKTKTKPTCFATRRFKNYDLLP